MSPTELGSRHGTHADPQLRRRRPGHRSPYHRTGHERCAQPVLDRVAGVTLALSACVSEEEMAARRQMAQANREKQINSWLRQKKRTGEHVSTSLDRGRGGDAERKPAHGTLLRFAQRNRRN